MSQLDLFNRRSLQYAGWEPHSLTAAAHQAEFRNMLNGGRQPPFKPSPMFPKIKTTIETKAQEI